MNLEPCVFNYGIDNKKSNKEDIRRIFKVAVNQLPYFFCSSCHISPLANANLR